MIPLQTLPPAWLARKLRHLAALWFSNVDKHSRPGEVPVRLCNYTDVYYHNEITDQLDFMQATATADEIERFKLRAGDVLVTKDSEEWDDIAVPAYVPADLDGVICGYHLAQIRPRQEIVIGKYLFYAFSTHGIREQFYVAANGVTRFGLSQDALKDGLFPVPPRPEQDVIVAFLDRKLQQIDRYLTNKRGQIELLVEARRSFAEQTVTGGLLRQRQTRDSGIPWLQQVPADWQVLAGKQVLRKLIIPVRHQDEVVTCFRDGQVTLRTNRRCGGFMVALKETGYQGVRYGHLVIHSMDAFAGAIGISDSDGKCTPEYIVCEKGRPDVELAYFALVFRVMARRGYIELSCSAVRERAPRLRWPTVGNMLLPLPPLEEQRAIVKAVSEYNQKTGASLAHLEHEVALITEYRTALIAEAVTGRLDVRQGN